MFGLSFGEIGVLLVVALIIIGPKDLPVLARGLKKALKKFYEIRAEVKGTMDEVLRETDLADLRDHLKEFRQMPARVLAPLDVRADLKTGLAVGNIVKTDKKETPLKPLSAEGAEGASFLPAASVDPALLSPFRPLQEKNFLKTALPQNSPMQNSLLQNGLKAHEEITAPDFIPPGEVFSPIFLQSNITALSDFIPPDLLKNGLPPSVKGSDAAVLPPIVSGN